MGALAKVDDVGRRLDRKLGIDKPLTAEKYRRAVRRWWVVPLAWAPLLALVILGIPELRWFLMAVVLFNGVQVGYLLAEHERLNGANRPWFASRRPAELSPRVYDSRGPRHQG